MTTEQVRDDVRGLINNARHLNGYPPHAENAHYLQQAQTEALIAIATILAYATGLDKED
jgi:hypothetical protein